MLVNVFRLGRTLGFTAYGTLQIGIGKATRQQRSINHLSRQGQIEPGNGERIHSDAAPTNSGAPDLGYERSDIPGFGGSGITGFDLHQPKESKEDVCPGRIDAPGRSSSDRGGIAEFVADFQDRRRGPGQAVLSIFFQNAHEFGSGLGKPRAAARDQVEVARNTELADFHFLEPAAFEFPRHAHSWNNSYAHPHLHKPLDAFDRGHFHWHVQNGAVAREEFDDPPAEWRLHNMRDEGFFAEFFDFNFLAFGEPVFWRHHQGQFILQNFRGLQLRVARHERNGAEVEAIVDDFVRNVAREHAVQADLHAGMSFAIFCERRKQSVDGTFVHAERKLASFEAIQFHEAFFDFVAKIQQPLGVFLQKRPGIGQANGARTPNEERLLQRILQFTDGQADGGLRAVQAFGGARETALLRNHKKHLQFSEIHGEILSAKRDRCAGLDGRRGNRGPPPCGNGREPPRDSISEYYQIQNEDKLD